MFASWLGLQPEAHATNALHGPLVAFGDEPVFSLSTVAGSGPGHTVIHVYGQQHELNNPLSTIIVGTVVPADHRLDYATELFDVVDIDGQGSLDSKKLQLALRIVSLQLRPKDIFRRFGSCEGALLVEEFVLFMSTIAKTEELITLVPLELLQEVKSLFRLCSQRNGTLDKQELATLVSYLGLDWSHDDVKAFMGSGSKDCLAFMCAFVRNIEQGVISGEKTLSVRNWFPGAWHVRDSGGTSGTALHLYFRNAAGGWTDVGKILSAANLEEQPLLIAMRMSDGHKFNALLPKMDASHAQVFKQAAATFANVDVPLGVVSTSTAVELINSITGAVHLKQLSRHDLIKRVFTLLLGEVDSLGEDELLVVLKLLGQHTEPEHLTYLLAQAPRKSLGSLGLEQLVTLIQGTDVRLSLPLQTVEKLKDAFFEFDTDRDGALSVAELKNLTSVLGLKWTSKDIMTALGFTTKHQIADIVRVDFLQFIDVIIEAYGDPFYELRYRYLFRLIDVQNDNSLQDEEVIPILRAAGLDAETAKAACLRLLGGQLTMSCYQFAAGMFEEEITGEQFPMALLNLAMAFSNIDFDDAFEITGDKLLIIFRKIGARFTLRDRDTLMKHMDPSGDGSCSFKEFALAFSSVDRSKLGGLAAVFNVETLAFVSSYELTSTVEELVELRNVEDRPILERTAAKLLVIKGQTAAEAVDIETRYRMRRAEGVLDTVESTSETSFSPSVILRISLCCWFCVVRCLCYGVGSAGLAVLFEKLAKENFPVSENPDGTTFSGGQLYKNFAVTYAPAIFVSFLEALVIYYDLLRTALTVAQIAGLKLWPADPIRTYVSNSIIAEALELGHPTYVRFGVNPLRGSNELILKLCFLLYKARGGLSKFLIKIILRRVVTRSAVKGVFPLIGIPIVAFWNAMLAYQILKAVRTVALCRCCINGVTDALLGVHQELSRQLEAGVELKKAVELSRIKSFALASRHDSFDPTAMTAEMKTAILRTVAVAVVQSKRFHPNLELLMKHLMFRLHLDPSSIAGLDDETVFLEKCLPSLSRLDSYTVLSFMAFALTLDGELSISQKLYLKYAQACCSLNPSVTGITQMSKKFNGLTLQPEDVVFCLYSIRERDTEDGAADISALEQAEAMIGTVLKLLSF